MEQHILSTSLNFCYRFFTGSSSLGHAPQASPTHQQQIVPESQLSTFQHEKQLMESRLQEAQMQVASLESENTKLRSEAKIATGIETLIKGDET